MPITADMIKAEISRLRDLREKMWADINQMIGAENQLAAMLKHLESEPTSDAKE